MFQAANLPSAPVPPYGAPYACSSGPRFGPSAYDQYGPGAWPSMFGYDSAAPALSMPGPDPRPVVSQAGSVVGGPVGGPVANGGFVGGPVAGDMVGPSFVCSAFGLPRPRWFGPAPVLGARRVATAPASDAGLGDVGRGLLWFGAGLVLLSVLNDWGKR